MYRTVDRNKDRNNAWEGLEDSDDMDTMHDIWGSQDRQQRKTINGVCKDYTSYKLYVACNA